MNNKPIRKKARREQQIMRGNGKQRDSFEINALNKTYDYKNFNEISKNFKDSNDIFKIPNNREFLMNGILNK